MGTCYISAVHGILMYTVTHECTVKINPSALSSTGASYPWDQVKSWILNLLHVFTHDCSYFGHWVKGAACFYYGTSMSGAGKLIGAELFNGTDWPEVYMLKCLLKVCIVISCSAPFFLSCHLVLLCVYTHLPWSPISLTLSTLYKQ